MTMNTTIETIPTTTTEIESQVFDAGSGGVIRSSDRRSNRSRSNNRPSMHQILEEHHDEELIQQMEATIQYQRKSSTLSNGSRYSRKSTSSHGSSRSSSYSVSSHRFSSRPSLIGHLASDATSILEFDDEDDDEHTNYEDDDEEQEYEDEDDLTLEEGEEEESIGGTDDNDEFCFLENNNIDEKDNDDVVTNDNSNSMLGFSSSSCALDPIMEDNSSCDDSNSSSNDDDDVVAVVTDNNRNSMMEFSSTSYTLAPIQEINCNDSFDDSNSNSNNDDITNPTTAVEEDEEAKPAEKEAPVEKRRSVTKNKNNNNNGSSTSMSSLLSSGSSSSVWSHHDDFFADSPYFNATMEKEIIHERVAAETLRDIANEVQMLTEIGKKAIIATRRLSKCCRFMDKEESSSTNNTNKTNNIINEQDVDAKRKALGTELSILLNGLGRCLNDVADAQENMYNIIDESLGCSNVDFIEKDIKTSKVLRMDAIKKTESTEKELSKHITSSNQYLLSSLSSSSRNGSTAGGLGVGDSIRSNTTSSTRTKSSAFDFFGSSALSSRTSSNTSSSSATLFNDSGSVEVIEGENIVDVEMTKNRLHDIAVSQVTSELARLQLIEHFVIAKNQRDLKISDSIKNVLYKIQKGYHKSINTAGIILPLAKQCTIELTENYTEHCELWQERYNDMTSAMINIKNSEVAIPNDNDNTITPDNTDNNEEEDDDDFETSFAMDAMFNKYLPNNKTKNKRTTSGGSSDGTLSLQTTSAPLEFIEKSTKFWNVPNMLAATSQCRRPKPKGVKLEGWLYQKSIPTLFLSKKDHWERKWFIIKNGAIYNIQGSCYIKEKICDIVLTTVRVPTEDFTSLSIRPSTDSSRGSSNNSNNNHRFEFQLIVPNVKHPITLRASGYDEMELWVNTIRSTIDKELSRGSHHHHRTNTATPPPTTLSRNNDSCNDDNNNIGRQFRGRSSEIFSTIKGISTRINFGKSWNDNITERNPNNSDSNNEDNNKNCSSLSKSNNKSTGNGSGNYYANCNDSSSLMDSTTSFYSPLVNKVMEYNDYCAECNAPNPDWVSLNIGILICLNCSGVHRSLGVHISKVRSLALDSLSDKEANLLLALGNDRSNTIYEDSVMIQNQANDDYQKPNPNSDQSKRELYIKNKYVTKKYMMQKTTTTTGTNDNSSCDNKESNKKLFEAAKKGDVIGIASAIAHGGNVNWKDNDNMTSIQMCLNQLQKEEKEKEKNNNDNKRDDEKEEETLAKYTESIELLLQNGATWSSVTMDNNNSKADNNDDQSKSSNSKNDNNNNNSLSILIKNEKLLFPNDIEKSQKEQFMQNLRASEGQNDNNDNSSNNTNEKKKKHEVACSA